MKRNKTITLLLALSLVLAMSGFAWADSYEAPGGTYTFDGSKIVAEDSMDISQVLDELIEPGDTVSVTLDYVNGYDEVTEWYMENTVLDTLETLNTMQAGYTYKLTNVGPDGTTTTLFDTKEQEVGGGTNDAGTGLEQATNAAAADDKNGAKQDYFFIQELQPGEAGKTVLEVGLDGETHINSYEEKDGQVEISYAVELGEGEDTIVYEHVPGKGVKTGDTTQLIESVCAFAGALLCLIIGILSARKDRRKDGDEA